MEIREYKCKYCYKEFKPTRRGVQKFCSDSCRVSSHRYKNKKTTLLPKAKKINPNQKIKVDKISWAGVGNATLGSVAGDFVVNAFTLEDNKNATKGDIKRLESKLNRFHLIKNIQPNFEGKQPYYDLVLGVLVYI